MTCMTSLYLLIISVSFHFSFLNALTLKAPNKNCSRRHFNFYFYLPKKIRLDFHVNPLPSRGVT